jgi:uncharacterized membrane protein
MANRLRIAAKEHDVNENRIRRVVTAGVLSALTIVLGATGLGFIPLPLGAITILQVPVIIGAALEGPVVGVVTGLLFGIFSIVQAAFIGVSPVDLAFLHYPWIAIVPRLLIGPVAWFMYALISGSLFQKREKAGAENGGQAAEQRPVLWRETLAVAVAAAAGSLTNTVLVLGALALALPDIVTWALVIGLVSLNGIVEAGFSAAIALAVILPWKGLSRRRKSRLNS